MPSFPKSFKAAVVVEKGKPFEIKDVPWKDAEAGEVVVKVKACGVCHSDAAVVQQMMPTGLPRIPGHEIIGDVVQVGPGEKKWKVGDRVGSGWHGGHDSICARCRKGDFVTCENEQINGVTRDGGYAEYAVLRSEAVGAVPEDMDPAETAALFCAGVTTFNSIRHMNLMPGDVVAVQGLGGLGHLAVQFCRKMGYKTVALSSSGAKKDLAMSLGAHEYLDGSKVNQAEELQKLGGAKVVVATAPNSEIIQTLVGALAADGQLLALAITPEMNVPIMPMIVKRLSLRGWPSGTAADSEDTINFARANDIHCQIQRFKLDDANDAYQAMMEGKARFRSVLVME